MPHHATQVMNPLRNLPRATRAYFFFKRSVAWHPKCVENPWLFGLKNVHFNADTVRCELSGILGCFGIEYDWMILNAWGTSGHCKGKNWCEQIEEALKVLSDGKPRKSIEKPEADNFKDYEHKSMFPSLYRWKISTLVQHKGAKAETRFLRLLFLSANTLQLPMCAGEGHELETMQRWEELHLKLLKDRVSTSRYFELLGIGIFIWGSPVKRGYVRPL